MPRIHQRSLDRYAPFKLTETNGRNELTEIEIKADNPHNTLVGQLDLLIPWELPESQTVSYPEKIKLVKALKLVIKASQIESYQAQLKLVCQALTVLGEVDVYPAEIARTQSHLQAWEVKDYDKYFNVNHVETTQTAATLVKGLLITYQTFIQLVMQNNNLDTEQIKMQKQGFYNYAHLLTRVFNLSLETTAKSNE